VNLSNVKHLNIPVNYEQAMPSILLKILKEAPDLSSLCIESAVLKSLLNKNELCKYLNKMIKKLDISNYYDHRCITSDEINALYEIFPNIEQLSCAVNEPVDWLLILNKFSKLSSLSMFLISSDFYYFLPSFKDQTSKLNLLLYEDAELAHKNVKSIAFDIWTDVIA
jgi:hypothetical protein